MAVESDTPLAGTAPNAAAPKSVAEYFADEEPDDESDTPQQASEEDADTETRSEGEEGEGEKPEPTEESDDDDAYPDEAGKLTAVEIDGKKFTPDEIKKGFLRQEDYTRKTQALADEKREVNAAVERVTQQDQQARQALELAEAVLKAVIPPMPTGDLLERDPVAFVKAREQHEAALRALNELDGRNRQLGESKTREQQAAERKAIEAEQARMLEMLPELGKPEGLKKFRDDAIEFGRKHYDLAPEEIDGIKSAKELAILKDAISYRKLMSQKMTKVAEAKNAPKIVARPGTREQRPANAIDALRKLGRPPSAAEIFTAMED